MNFGNLIRAFDALMAFGAAARRLTAGSPPPAETALSHADPAAGLAGQLEARLTGVVVAALKEAFERDHARLELERAQIEDQRRRAEEALRLELHRQAADRELARLRLLAAVALVGWIASLLVIGGRLGDAPVQARAVLGVGWVLLLGALGAAFTAQGRISAYVPESRARPDGGPSAPAALWLLMAGLALTAVALLLT